MKPESKAVQAKDFDMRIRTALGQTRVLVNDPTCGYGILLENMLRFGQVAVGGNLS